MEHTPKNIFLADDDADDCDLFEDALREVCKKSNLTISKDGMELMAVLNKTVPPPPDIIFLDLNMPRKNGFECLDEIRHDPKLKNIPIVIFSTSAQPEAVNKTYSNGANYYMTKPGSFPLLKKAIQSVLLINDVSQPVKEKFVLSF